MKKIIIMLLIAIMVLGSIPVYASNQSADVVIVALIDKNKKDLIIMAKETTFKKSNESLASKLAKIQDLNLREGSEDYFVYQRSKENSTLTKKITDIYPSYFITYSDNTTSTTFSSISNQEFGSSSKDLYLSNGYIMNTNDGNRMPVSYLFDYNNKRNANLGNIITKDEKDDADKVVTTLTNSWTKIKAFVLSSTNKRELNDTEFSALLYGIATKSNFTIQSVNFSFEKSEDKLILKNDLTSLGRLKSIDYIDKAPKRTLSKKNHIDENDYLSLSMMVGFALINEKGLGINTSSYESLDLNIVEQTTNKLVGSINSLTNKLLNTDESLIGDISENKDGLIKIYYQYGTATVIVIGIIVLLFSTVKGKHKNMNENADVRSYLYSVYGASSAAILVFVSGSVVISFLFSLNNIFIMLVKINGINTIDVNSMNILVSLLFLVIAVPIAAIKSIMSAYTMLLPLFLLITINKYQIDSAFGNTNSYEEVAKIVGFALASSVFSILNSIAIAFINFLVLKGFLGLILTPIVYLVVVLFIFETVNTMFKGVFKPIIVFLKIFGINLEVVGSITSSVGRAVQAKVNQGMSSSNSSAESEPPVSYSSVDTNTDLKAKSNSFNQNNENSFKPESTSTNTDTKHLESGKTNMRQRLDKMINNPQTKILANGLGKAAEATGAVFNGAGRATEGLGSVLQNGSGFRNVTQGVRDMGVESKVAAKALIDTPAEMFKQHKYDKFLENGATKSFTETGNGYSYEISNDYFNKHGVDVGFDKGYKAKWNNDNLSGDLRDNANYINHLDKTLGTDTLMKDYGFSDFERDSKGRINGFTLKANSDEKDSKGKPLFNNNIERVLGISSIKKDDANNSTIISKQGIYKNSSYQPIPDLRKVQKFDNALSSVLSGSNFESLNRTGISFNTEQVRDIAKDRNINLDEMYKKLHSEAV